jgi:hypothetical protein
MPDLIRHPGRCHFHWIGVSQARLPPGQISADFEPGMDDEPDHKTVSHMQTSQGNNSKNYVAILEKVVEV